jgi:hypothetical protein
MRKLLRCWARHCSLNRHRLLLMICSKVYNRCLQNRFPLTTVNYRLKDNYVCIYSDHFHRESRVPHPFRLA